MKKLLLLAALAAVAFGANADGYKIEKVWELSTSSVFNTTGVNINNVRQGFGMNGKFYFNDKNIVDGAIPTIYEVDENGPTGVTFPGGANCGITRDEAGNILVSTATFPGAWGANASIKVINPATGESVEYIVPSACGLSGRCDFLGFAKGNFFEDGEIWLTGKTSADVYTDGVAILTIEDGEVNVDECYRVTNNAITAATMRDNMTVVNYYKDLNGKDAFLYVYRSASINVEKLTLAGETLNCQVISLPGKGACNGTFPFVWDGKEFFLYPTTPNYLNGFAIAALGDTLATVTVEPTVAANMNGYQCNWLNAEVDADGVTIYQYAPGANFTVWRLTKDVPEPKKVYILGEVNDQDWAANAGTEMAYDAENNVYTATVTLDGRGESGENYFSFTTELANDNDEGGWAYIAPFRFGAVSENDFWYDDMYDGQPLGLTYENGQAFRVMNGEYKLTVSLENMTLTIERVNNGLRGDVNKDENVSIADVTALIDYLLSHDATNISLENADCNLDENISIADVTALIDYLLSHQWSN